MTKEEAIKLLDPETTGEAIAEIEYYAGFSGKKAAIHAITDACVIAVESIRKQVPMKVVEHESVFDWFGEKHHHYYNTCPACGAVLDGGNNCSECGQALDWGDEE